MSTPRRVAPAARDRIHAFSLVLTAVAVLVIGIVTLAWVVPRSGAAGPRITTNSDYYYPWENPDPVDATAVDDATWSGQGQAVIRLSGLDTMTPLKIEVDGSQRNVTGVVVVPAGQTPRAPGVVHADLTLYDPVAYAIPPAADIDVWVRVRERDPWTMSITPAELPARSGTVSGIGPDVFLYTGDASAARAVTRGRVYVEIVSASGLDHAFSSSETPEGSFAWPDTPAALFIIDAGDDTAAWSITFFETAAEADDE